MIFRAKPHINHILRTVFYFGQLHSIFLILGLTGLMMFKVGGCFPVDPVAKNNLPIAVIQSIPASKEGDTVELNGSDSYDPDGDAITCQWTLLEGPSEVSWGDQKSLVTHFVASIKGIYRFELTVDDGRDIGRSSIDVEILPATNTKPEPDPDSDLIVATPIFDPADGLMFAKTLEVSISCATADARIYYTLDDSTPGLENGSEYTGPIFLEQTTKVRAIAVCDGMKSSQEIEANYTRLGSVSIPIFDPPNGNAFQNTLQVAISCVTEGATIYYTSDGTVPTPETGILYTQPMELDCSTILKAAAFKEGMNQSLTASATYNKLGTVSPVAFSPVAGEMFTEILDVTLSCETPDAVIYYTLDGSEPSETTGLLYTAPISLSQTSTIKAVAFKENMYNCPVAEAQYSRWDTVADPEFFPKNQNQFQNSMDIELVCATPEAIIMYTTDGRKPTQTYGTVYTGPITLTTSSTVKAFAYRDGMFDSTVVTAGYVRLYPVANPVISPRNGMSFQDDLDVKITTATVGATIRYTTDGTDPSRENGKTYTGAIRLTATTTIKTMAYKYSMIDTPIISATYPKVVGGVRKWIYEAGNYIDSTAAISADGTIYVGSYDQNLYALNPDGTLRWIFRTGGIVFSSPIIAKDGTIFIGSINGILYAVYPNGSLKWSYNTGKTIVSSPSIGSDGSIYIRVDGKLIALNPNGSLKWECGTPVTGSYNYSSPAVGRDGTIYFGSVDKNIYAVAPNGIKKWTFQTGNYVDCSPAIGSDGTIYIGSGDWKLYALNPNGSLKWSCLTGGYIDSSAAIASDGTIYVGSADHKLYAINPNGSPKWTFLTNREIHSSPAIRNDGVLYIASMDGNLYAVGADGSRKWSYTTDGAIDASPAIGSDGTVYIGSKDRKMYAIGGPGCLGDTPWPKFQYNERQSGSLNEP